MRCLSLSVTLTSAPLASSHFISSFSVSSTFIHLGYKFTLQIKSSPQQYFALWEFQHFSVIFADNSYLTDMPMVGISNVYVFTHFNLFLYYITYVVRGIMQSTSGLSWDCAATKCYYSLAATSHFFPFIGVMKNSEYISLPLSLSLISRLSISLPPYRSSNPIRLLRLRESHSEDMAAHLIWAQIDSSMSCEGMQIVYVFIYWKWFFCVCVYAYVQKCCKSSLEIDGCELIVNQVKVVPV